MKRPVEIGDNLAFVLIIFLIIVCILLGGYIDSKAQTVTLPTWVADSLIFEAKLSRQCSQVMAAQANEILALGKENVHLGKALQLSEKKSIILDSLVSNQKESNVILTMQFSKDLREEKRKAKRWRKIAVLETIGLIGIGLLILL